MRRSLSHVLAFVLLLSPLSLAARSSSSHSTHSSSSHHSSTKNSAGKTEHVQGYTTKNGKYVAPYDRHPAGTAPSKGSTSPSYKKNYVAPGYTAHSSVARDKNGKIKRSETAKNDFKREHPCPANGHTSGSCPGYVIDHVNPLECGGADAPSNMQWQTVADGKAKDKTERYCR